MDKMWFGSMPSTEKVGGKKKDRSLIGRDAAVWLERLIQGEERRGSVKHKSSFREVTTRFAK
jgi:hypothetical protein